MSQSLAHVLVCIIFSPGVAPRAEELCPFGAIFFGDPVPPGVARGSVILPAVTRERDPSVRHAGRAGA